MGAGAAAGEALGAGGDAADDVCDLKWLIRSSLLGNFLPQKSPPFTQLHTKGVGSAAPAPGIPGRPAIIPGYMLAYGLPLAIAIMAAYCWACLSMLVGQVGSRQRGSVQGLGGPLGCARPGGAAIEA